MKIEVVWFNDAIILGKSCTPMRTLNQGERFEGGNVAIDMYDDRFIRLQYTYANAAKNYAELIPMLRCDKVIYSEVPVVQQSDEPATKARKAKAV